MVRLFIYTFYLLLPFGVVAQSKNDKTKKNSSPENVSDILSKARPDSIAPYMIAPSGDTINVTDNHNLKQGKWVITTGGAFDEPTQTLMGIYINGKKFGHWKSYEMGALVSDENYYNNCLDGTSSYYENGGLLGIASYFASHSLQERDTIVVKNPVTDEERIMVVKTDNTSYRDGEWRYYNPITGKLKKVELYVLDELVQEKDFTLLSENKDLSKRSELHVPHVGAYKKFEQNNSSHIRMDRIKFIQKKSLGYAPNWK
jgi:hypothetical protein